jgi:integrase/recombinase XerD
MSLNEVLRGADNVEAADRDARCIGPLATHLEGFIARLRQDGYSKSHLYIKALVIRRLSSWLARRTLTLQSLDEKCLVQFHAYRRRHVSIHMRKNDVTTGRQLLGFLRGLGCIPGSVPSVDRTALGKLMGDFERFLRSQRGLAPTTVGAYVECARRLLAQRFRGRALSPQQLRARDVDRFVLREARRIKPISVKKTVAALRCFLRYALQRGTIKTDLVVSLPKVAVWRFSDVPKSLLPDQVQRLLDSCDRSSVGGSVIMRSCSFWREHGHLS